MFDESKNKLYEPVIEEELPQKDTCPKAPVPETPEPPLQDPQAGAPPLDDVKQRIPLEPVSVAVTVPFVSERYKTPFVFPVRLESLKVLDISAVPTTCKFEVGELVPIPTLPSRSDK